MGLCSKKNKFGSRLLKTTFTIIFTANAKAHKWSIFDDEVLSLNKHLGIMRKEKN